MAGFTLILPAPLLAQKTDTVLVKKGYRVVGEMKTLERGQLTLSTDAMGTVSVKWPDIVSVHTKKTFEIELADGRIYFGSLTPGAQDSLGIVTDSVTLFVYTQSVVSLQRIKATLWDALDGNVNLGINYTQQNSKVDVNLSGEVDYARRGSPPSADAVVDLDRLRAGFIYTKLVYSATFSSQDSTEAIKKYSATLSRQTQLRRRWFWIANLGVESNTQLSLDYRGTLSLGVGRFLEQSNRMTLGVWAGPAYSRERYTGESPDNSIPLIFAADFEYFTWGALDTNISSQLGVLPILNQWGRWRVTFDFNVNREVVNNLYINLGVTEAYDSNPTAPGANKNDFTFTTSLGWSF